MANQQEPPKREPSFVGWWKTRNGDIVIVKGYCATTIAGELFSGWYGVPAGQFDPKDPPVFPIYYWDDEGKHIKFRQLDLISRGVESYGALVFD